MFSSIQLFHGVQDNFEDLDKYIEDFNWAYTQDYQFTESFYSFKAKQTYINKTYKILFCNHLKKRAKEWYLNLAIMI